MVAARMNTHVRIAIVEDSPEFRDTLVQVLQARAGWQVVAQCSCAMQARHLVPHGRPDLILLDLLLPDTSGIELISELKSRCPAAAIVMLTVVDSPESIVHALEAGACGYILKGGSGTELLAAVEDVLGGGAAMSPAVARRLVDWFQARPAGQKSNGFGLTEREWEVLRLAARGKQHGEISELLGIAVNTIKNHFRNIYEKLGVSSLTDALVKLNNGRGLLDR
jgi:DNA-binding NarL/FixJ family response regulator